MDASRELAIEAPYEYVSQMRASIVVMGPLLARKWSCESCNARRVVLLANDQLICTSKDSKLWGAEIIQKDGYIEAIASELKRKYDLPWIFRV